MSASPTNNGSAAAAAAPTSVNEARDPSGFLSEIIGAPVTVKLNSGVVYRGVFCASSLCVCFAYGRKEMKDDKRQEDVLLTRRGNTGELQSVDGYMNIALEQTNEIVDGKVRRNYGDAFVRGNNGM